MNKKEFLITEGYTQDFFGSLSLNGCYLLSLINAGNELSIVKISIFDAEKVKEYLDEKDKAAAEKAAEEQRVADEKAAAERLANPTETDLLKKIIELLESKR